jgi:hypothetical protein
MKADMVVFDCSTPTMLAAAAEDPVSALVLHSSPRDIDMVIVDGIIRKEGGRLVDMKVAPATTRTGDNGAMEVGIVVSWKDVTGKNFESRSSLKLKLDKVDMKKGEDYAVNLFYLNKKGMLESRRKQSA